LGHFLKNSGFLKIVVFRRKNQCFQELGLPKIEPNFNKKTIQNLEGWKHIAKGTWQQLFSPKSGFLVDFGVPFGVQNCTKNGSSKKQVGFLASWGPWGAPRGHFGSILGGIWAPLGTILRALGVILGPFLRYSSNKRSKQKQTKQKSNKQWQKLAGNRSQQQQTAANIGQKAASCSK
jgi:hypothetical protein